MDTIEAFSADHLREVLNSNKRCPDFPRDRVDRVVELAQQRASTRGDSALDDDAQDAIVTTDWTNFASGEFGTNDTVVNTTAIGTFKPGPSRRSHASLFTNTMVVQEPWLRTGDGRRTKVTEYVSDDFEDATPGEFWLPDSAREYVAIVRLSDELVHGQPTVADAM